MLSNFKIFISVFLWYLIPYVLLVVMGHELQIVPIILFFFLLSFSLTFMLFNRYEIKEVSIFKFNYFVFFKRVIILSLLLSLFGLYKYYASGGQTEDMRESYFAKSGGVFGNSYLYTAYESFLAPMVILALAWLLNEKTFTSSKKYVILAFIFLLIDGFFRQGRFQYLYAIFFVLLFREVLKIKASKLLIYISGLFFLIFYTLYSRLFVKDSAIGSFTDILNYDLIANSTINYQFYGYVYLEQLVSKASYFGNFFDFNSFSFAFYLLNTFLFTKIGLYIDSPWEAHNLDLTAGTYSPVFDVDFNAFCTNFYPIYLDGGVLGIILFGFLSGFIIAVKSNSQYVKFLKAITFFTLIFGIYQPTITYLVGFLFLILGMSFVFKNFVKLFR